jgi:hypothetical protein
MKHMQKKDNCDLLKAEDVDEYLGNYYNQVYGMLNIRKENNQTYLYIGPQGIKWQLNACKKNTLRAKWPDPNGLNLPMLMPGDDLIKFKKDSQEEINTMIIPFLNGDGNGVFIRK